LVLRYCCSFVLPAMYPCLAYLLLGVWLCDAGNIKSSVETCDEECVVQKQQLLQTREALSKEREGEEEDEEDEEDEEIKELLIGKNKYDKTKSETKCVENRKGWYCPEDAGDPDKRLNDKGKDYKDKFSIYMDVNKNKICADRIDATGWAMKLKIACYKTPHMKTIKIGKNKDKKVPLCVDEARSMTCDMNAGDKEKRLKDKKYNDKFDISVSDSKVCATRKDGTGWALDLKIKCAKNAELIRVVENVNLCLTVESGKLRAGEELAFIGCKQTETMDQLFKYDSSKEQIKLIRNPDLCLNVWEGKREALAPIKTDKCAGDDSDKFVFEDNKFKLKQNPDLCLGYWSTQSLKLVDCSVVTTNLLVSNRELTPTKGAALIRPLQDMDLCVDVAGGVLASGVQVGLWRCKTGASKLNQVFQFSPGGEIKPFGALHLCLNIWDGKIESGTPVKTYECQAASHTKDKWLLENNQIKVKADTSLCLGTKDGDFSKGKGRLLQLTDCKMKLNAFHVTGEDAMDCPWKKTNSNMLHPTCGDGTESHREPFYCVLLGHGQRIKCPKDLPKMCKDTLCGGDRDHCCEKSCVKHGGDRPC